MDSVRGQRGDDRVASVINQYFARLTELSRIAAHQRKIDLIVVPKGGTSHCQAGDRRISGLDDVAQIEKIEMESENDEYSSMVIQSKAKTLPRTFEELQSPTGSLQSPSRSCAIT
jgi:hypothetical protein